MRAAGDPAIAAGSVVDVLPDALVDAADERAEQVSQFGAAVGGEILGGYLAVGQIGAEGAVQIACELCLRDRRAVQIERAAVPTYPP